MNLMVTLREDGDFVGVFAHWHWVMVVVYFIVQRNSL